jgi:MFS transporter, DHA1 family, multidrug resistance protein
VFPAAILMAVFSVPLSHYGEKIGRARAVHVGMGLCSLGLAFLSLGAFIHAFRAPWALAIGGIPLGIGFLLAIPAWMASVSDIDPQRRGANIGAVMTAQGLGAIIGAPIGATLYEKLQPISRHYLKHDHLAHYAPFLGCTTFVTIGWLLSLRLLKDRNEPER